VPHDARGFLWFLRILAVSALPMWGLGHEIGAISEAGVIVALAACAAGAGWIARRIGPGALQFAVAGAVLAAETTLAAVVAFHGPL
jgi:hypothetical protein